MPLPPISVPPIEEYVASGWYLRGDIGMSNQQVKSLFNVLWNSTSIWTSPGGVDAGGCCNTAERIARWIRAFHALSAERGAAIGPRAEECVSTIVETALGKLGSLERSGHSPLARHELEAVRRLIVTADANRTARSVVLRLPRVTAGRVSPPGIRTRKAEEGDPARTIRSPGPRRAR